MHGASHMKALLRKTKMHAKATHKKSHMIVNAHSGSWLFFFNLGYTSHPLHGLNSSHARILKLATRWHPWHDHFQVQDFQVTNLVGPKMTIEGEKCGSFPNFKVLNKLNNPQLTPPKNTSSQNKNVQQKFDRLEEKSCCVIMWNHFAN